MLEAQNIPLDLRMRWVESEATLAPFAMIDTSIQAARRDGRKMLPFQVRFLSPDPGGSVADLRKLTLAEKLGIKEGSNVTVAGLFNKNGILDFGVYTTYEQLPRIVVLKMLNISRKLTHNLPRPEQRAIIANAMRGRVGQSSAWIQGHHVPGVQWSLRRPRGLQDLVLYFARARTELAAELPMLKSWLAENGVLWIAWPKQACEIVMDLDRKIVHKLATKNSLTDVKHCSIDKQWFAVKFILACTDRDASRTAPKHRNQ